MTLKEALELLLVTSFEKYANYALSPQEEEALGIVSDFINDMVVGNVTILWGGR